MENNLTCFTDVLFEFFGEDTTLWATKPVYYGINKQSDLCEIKLKNGWLLHIQVAQVKPHADHYSALRVWVFDANGSKILVQLFRFKDYGLPSLYHDRRYDKCFKWQGNTPTRSQLKTPVKAIRAFANIFERQ